MKHVVFLAVATTVAGCLSAQSNTVSGLDGRLTIVDTFTYQGRRGAAYPNGEVGAAMMNEMCNPGSVKIPWFQAMAANHPKFGFLMVRVANDKIEQISDRSFCKHAFFSTNAPSTCGGTCVYPGSGSEMGLNCSDIYGVSNNADRNWLGPADEMNPWTGVWVPTGSYFDIGDPSQAGYPLPADGVDSLNPGSFDNVKNRVTMKEQDLITAGAQYFYGIHLMHEGEGIDKRGDNLASRGCTPTWSGSTWSFPNNAVGQAHGTILQRWPGATIYSGQNGDGTPAGTSDGRFFVAVKTTSLGGGQYHYEYAIHNVDNNRGGATFRIPVDAAAVVTNYSFRDIDSNALNNWTGAKVGTEIVFTAPGGNALKWNTIYNFGFDCNVQPSIGTAKIDQALPGPGALFVDVTTKVPSGLPGADFTLVGTGCANCPSSFYEEPGFDLANTKIKLTYTANGYTVGPSTATYVAPSGGSLGLSDESDANYNLPFSLPYPGGTTNALRICSNGYISIASGNGVSYTPSSAAFLSSAQPRWAPAWHDWNPGGSNNVYVNAATGVVRVTWLNVPNWTAPTGSSTFQVQFESNGNVHFLYNTITTNADPYLVGWTRGGNALNPGSRDISATLAAGWAMCASDLSPISLNSSARPILNTTINLTTSNLPAGTFGGFMMLGFTFFPTGIDLTALLNMPTCNLYAFPDITVNWVPSGNSNVFPFSVPNDNGLLGVNVMAQSVSFSPGINPASLLTTNGVQLLFGLL